MPHNRLSTQERIHRLFTGKIFFGRNKDNISETKRLENRIDALTSLVIELLREVEALRSTELEKAKIQSILPKDSIYGRQYRKTALLTHDSAGPSGGIDKLLHLWCAESSKETSGRFAGYLEELLMLERLGYSKEDIRKYLEEVREHSRRT